MADNFTTNPGTGGQTFASDDIAGVQYPISKIAFGAPDSVTQVSLVNPLPVAFTSQALTDAQLRAAPVPFTANALPLPSDAATLPGCGEEPRAGAPIARQGPGWPVRAGLSW